jgi:hypothetical protein
MDEIEFIFPGFKVKERPGAKLFLLNERRRKGKKNFDFDGIK